MQNNVYDLSPLRQDKSDRIINDSIPLDEPRAIVADKATPESAKQSLMETFATILDELFKDPDYCGMNIEVHKIEEENKIVCIQMFPCDNVGGNAARRI